MRSCRITLWTAARNGREVEPRLPLLADKLICIFQAAITLQVNIEPLPADVERRRVFTRGDLLDALDVVESGSTRRDKWRAHLLIVDEIHSRRARPLGLMFDEGRPPDGQKGFRRGCAVALNGVMEASRPHPGAESDLLARTIGHEMGHLFNLGHDERPSLMTPLSWFMGGKTFPRNLDFKLAPSQAEWLRNGPEHEVRPGGGAFHGLGGG